MLVSAVCTEEYECIRLYNDYKVVFKGTKDVAYRISKKNYSSQDYCEEDLKAYLSRHQ